MDATEAADVASITHKIGIGPDPGDKSALDKVDSAAPPPIIMAPPRPLAVPARCGRTDNIPEVALGKTSPFPSPTKIKNPKKTSGWCKPKAWRTVRRTIPTKVKIVPAKTILFNPKRTE